MNLRAILSFLPLIAASVALAQGPPAGGGPPGGGPPAGGGPPGGGPPGGGASGDGIWYRNAAYGEISTFDGCNGHQPEQGQYHHHVNPLCLRAQLNDNLVVVSTGRIGTQYSEKTTGLTHSPILGWAIDGYPVYGPYGYSDPKDNRSAARRMQAGFQLRAITQRRTLPAWYLPFVPSASQTLAAAQYGPDVSAVYPLGRYVPDYDFIAGSGDLDQYNGRFTLTPEYPNGTYAYFVTIAADGSPVFPYIFNVQIYGTSNGGSTQTVATDAVDYFNGGSLKQAVSIDPILFSWYTKGSLSNATAISGFDPSAGPSTTWPNTKPAGVTVNGGNATPALADTQRVRSNASNVYLNSNNLPSYPIGPWFAAGDGGGVFQNWAAATASQYRLTRAPAIAATKGASGLGAVGVWVNGVAIFNNLDGATYSNASGSDQGGGGVAPRVITVSTSSAERGPVSPGALATAYSEFNATLATSTAAAPVPAAGSDWPPSLGGAIVTLTDSTGAVLPAGIIYASPTQLNYRIPASAASGTGRITVTVGSATATGNINVIDTYPGMFRIGTDNLAAAYVQRVKGSTQSMENVFQAGTAGAIVPATVTLGSDQVYLVLYGTGIGSAGTTATATIGGVNSTIQYAGAQGEYPGLDQVNLLIPPSLAGRGKVEVVVTAGGKQSNPVYVVVR